MKNAKTLAVMQPYVFPYAGYFSLLCASDVFVYYDDVNYINKGWINRNRILINGSPYMFSVPLSNGSQNELICDVALSDFAFFRNKFLKTLRQAYSRAPNFDVGMTYVEKVLSPDWRMIGDLAIASVEEARVLLGIDAETRRSSSDYRDTRGADRSDRLIEIARCAGCSRYVNAAGGTELYDKTYFRGKGVELVFLEAELAPYRQLSAEPVPGLSIIDLLMNLGAAETARYVANYKLL